MNRPLKPVSREARTRVIVKNSEYFDTVVQTLMDEHEGRFALLRNCEVIAIYDTSLDAMEAGGIFYEDFMFSVQEVQTEPLDLGNFPLNAALR